MVGRAIIPKAVERLPKSISGLSRIGNIKKGEPVTNKKVASKNTISEIL